MQQYIHYSSPWSDDSYGAAVDRVIIDDKGKMWASNGEYSTQVNYCPFTGTPAPIQMVAKGDRTYLGVIYKFYEETNNTP